MPPIHASELADAIRAIRALSDLHRTHSTLDEDRALEAMQADRPAFWTMAGYSNQLAGKFLTTANTEGLEAALAQCADEHAGTYLRTAPYLLGTLIPLNIKAHVERNAAWSRIGGDAESIQRARRKMPAPMFEAAE